MSRTGAPLSSLRKIRLCPSELSPRSQSRSLFVPDCLEAEDLEDHFSSACATSHSRPGLVVKRRWYAGNPLVRRLSHSSSNRQNMNFKEKFMLRGPPDARTGLPAAMSEVSVIVENELCKGAHIPLA
jgi:hypothetical protein